MKSLLTTEFTEFGEELHREAPEALRVSSPLRAQRAQRVSISNCEIRISNFYFVLFVTFVVRSALSLLVRALPRCDFRGKITHLCGLRDLCGEYSMLDKARNTFPAIDRDGLSDDARRGWSA